MNKRDYYVWYNVQIYKQIRIMFEESVIVWGTFLKDNT